jgi:hypothetical protein
VLGAGKAATEAAGDAARSLGAGDASGVARGLEEGDSIATRGVFPTRVGSVRAGDAADGGGGPVGIDGGVSSVTGIGTGEDTGSSNAPQGSSLSAASAQAPAVALELLDSAGALSNTSVCR